MTEYQVEQGARQRAEAEAKLYRDDGSPVYGDAEHRERLAAIRAEHAAAFDAIDADVGRKVQEAEERLLAAENPDIAGSLTTDELARASALSGFVAADAERLPAGELEKRLRAVAASEDRASMFGWAHHAGRRTDDLEGLDLAEPVAELRRMVAPERERKLAAAREALEEAQSLRELAYYKRRGVADAYGLYAQNAYGTSGS